MPKLWPKTAPKSALPDKEPARLFLSGLYRAEDVVLSLPRLAALRAACPAARVTALVPHAAVDLLERLGLADEVWTLERRHALSWLWQRFRGRFDAVLAPQDLPPPVADFGVIGWGRLMSDISFLAPPPPYVLLSLPEGFPIPRTTGLARKLGHMGYHVALIGRDMRVAAKMAAAAGCIDLTGRLSLPETVALASKAAAVIGGDDAGTLLAAMSGARTLLTVAEVAEDKADLLAPSGAAWLVCEDMRHLAVGDILRALEERAAL